jgi:hypothetical protein
VKGRAVKTTRPRFVPCLEAPHIVISFRKLSRTKQASFQKIRLNLLD